jgi:cytochrome c-type biogenesis protein CcmH
MQILCSVVLALAVLVSAPALAVQPDEVLSDQGLEARARGLSKELRCMVCQNQSIDDSDAPLARDLRILVRERLKEGDSDRQVINFLVARYGEFVLLKPRLRWHTALLWFGPPAVFLIGVLSLLMISRQYRSRSRAATEGGGEPGLTSAEAARLAQILCRREP